MKENSSAKDPILFSYKFAGKNGPAEIEEERIAKEIKSRTLTWVHLDANNKKTRKWLEETADYLDPFIFDALLAEETRPRVTEINDGALLMLRGVNLNEGADIEDMISIRLWIDKNRIISTQRRQLKAVLDMQEMIETGKVPHDSGEFLCILVSKLLERMEPVIADLNDKVDEIEDSIDVSTSAVLREEISQTRKVAIVLKRYLAPQRDAIAHLRMSDVNWLSKIQKRILQEDCDHLTRFVEDLDTVRERSQIAKDELTNISASKLNKNLYVLSIISAIFLPLGFLTGLLGINVGGIPGAENKDAFYIFCGILGGVIAVQVALLKKMKWF